MKDIPILSYLPIPFNSRILGKHSNLVQPLLPEGQKPEEVSTNQWAQLIPGMTGTMYLISLTPKLDGKVGDGAGFPAVVPWSIGVYMGNVNLDFGLASFSDTM